MRGARQSLPEHGVIGEKESHNGPERDCGDERTAVRLFLSVGESDMLVPKDVHNKIPKTSL